MLKQEIEIWQSLPILWQCHRTGRDEQRVNVERKEGMFPRLSASMFRGPKDEKESAKENKGQADWKQDNWKRDWCIKDKKVKNKYVLRRGKTSGQLCQTLLISKIRWDLKIYF